VPQAKHHAAVRQNPTIRHGLAMILMHVPAKACPQLAQSEKNKRMFRFVGAE
jgi:hypothetical protein